MSERENTTNRHVDEITLLMYVERQLDRESAQEVSLHTQTCDKCLTLLRALDRESRLLTRSMLEQDEPFPARLAEFQAKAKRSMQWIWGVVFGLAVLGVYALYTGYVEPWEQNLEQAGFGGTNLLSLLVFQGAFWKGWQSMFTLVEFVALASVAGFAFFAFRKYLRRGTSLAVLFASLSLLATLARPVGAQDVQVNVDMHKGVSLEVSQDEVWKKDLLFSGQRLKIAGTVDGDVYAFGQQVEIPGHVTGDVICFSQSLRINGQVDGNVRSFTNNTTISGNVERSVTAFTEAFNLDPKARIGRSLSVFAQTLGLEGKVERDVRAFFAQGSLGGIIGGNFKGRGESLSIASSAQFEGQASFQGDKPAEVASAAKFASPLEFRKSEHKSEMGRGTGFYVWRIIWATAFVLFGLVFLSLLPQFSKDAASNVENNVGASFGLGVLVACSVPIAALVACITVVGLFVGVSAFFVWYWSLYFAQVIVGMAVGQWILGKTSEFWPLVGRMAVGVVLLRVIMAVPYLGFWVKLGVILWGVGAISLALYRKLQPVVAPNIPSMPGPMGTPLPSNTTVGSA